MYDASELKKIDDIVFDSFMADNINACLDEIEDCVDNYGCVSVVDLLDYLDKYHLVFKGVDVRTVDRKYGWIDSDYFTYEPVKGGYKINIPWNQIVNLEENEQDMLKGGFTMIELKEIVVERCSYSTTDSIATKDINIELSAPFNLDMHEFHRNFQRMLDMQNRELNNRQFRGETFESSFTIPRTDSYSIRKIYHNKEKGTTVVCFYSSIRWLFYTDKVEAEGKKIIVKRDAEDHDDIYMAVASAVMIRKYKSNSQFKAHIRRSMPKEFDGRPDVYQIMAAAEVSDIYGSWEKFCEIVDERLEVYHAKRT